MTTAPPPTPRASAGPETSVPVSAGSASSDRFQDVVAGVVFVGVGGAFAVGALGYDLGTTLEPGPGYYPVILGGLLAALGLAVVVKGLLSTGQQALSEGPVLGPPSPGGGSGLDAPATPESGVANDVHDDVDDTRGRVPWVAAVFVIGAIIGFALAIRTLGLVPAVFGCAFVASLAGYRRRVVPALAVAAVLTAICYLIFVLLLQLSIPEFGTLFTG